jgi:multidrug efflux system membrane fusion protein
LSQKQIVYLALATSVLAGGAFAGRALLASSPDAGPNRKGGDRVVPVEAATAKTADVPIALTGLGTVVPRHTVTVRSRVTGQLLRVLFHEGDMVQEGQLLAEVDPRPFQVELTQIEGQVARDVALLDNALLDQQRYKKLTASELISKQQGDSQDSLVRQYQGTAHTDQGLLASSQLQLSFTRITAPTSGRIGLRLVDAGNNVTPADPTGIAVINAVQPITVVFSLPEDSVPAIVRRIRASQQAAQALPVEAWDRAGKVLVATGSLLTIDNQIDPTTGTVKLKAEFPNTDGTLFPNQFVNVRLLLDVRHGATVVPAVAVQRGSAGPFVYVATPEKTATVRNVDLGPADGANVAVEHGVAPGEIVVTNGTDQLREGAKLALATPPAAEGDHEAAWKTASAGTAPTKP